MSDIFISRDRQQLGQFSADEVAQGLRDGRFQPSDLGWKEGMAEWQPLSTFGLPPAAAPSPAPSAVETGLGGALAEASAPQRGSHLDQIAKLKEISVPEEGLPWEHTGGTIGRWWKTTSAILFSPIKSFRNMRVQGGLGKPIYYVALSSLFAVIVSMIVQVPITMLTSAASLSESGATDPAAIAAGTGMGLLCSIPIMFGIGVLAALLGAFLTAYVGGGVMHVCLLIFGAAGRGFEASARGVCYASGAATAMQIVPLVGALASLIYWPILLAIALKEAHKTDYWRVILALLLPTLVCCGMTIFLVLSFASYLGLQPPPQ